VCARARAGKHILYAKRKQNASRCARKETKTRETNSVLFARFKKVRPYVIAKRSVHEFR